VKRSLLNIALQLVLPFLAAVAQQAMAQTQKSPASSPRSEAVRKRIEPALRELLAQRGLAFGEGIYLRLFKAERELELWLGGGDGYSLFKTYPICTFSGRLGPKLAEGDLQAPEGFYDVLPGAMNPFSSYHLSFNIGYPNAFDRSHKRTGGLIMIHGSCVSIGCFAMTNAAIEEIYILVEASLRASQKSVPVHIFPFRFSDKSWQIHESEAHEEFWRSLEPAFHAFEKNKTPPRVRVSQGRYVVEVPHTE
jgi:murein L,D-transpeptidase YafK